MVDVREIRRERERFVTAQPGIITRHCFSAGAHYDPGNLAFGPLIGCDEHVVDVGAGFDWHTHRGVVIVSWVRAGELRHEDNAAPAPLVLGAGEVLVQSGGAGIRHRETNASGRDPLWFVQATLLLDRPAVLDRPTLPASYEGFAISVEHGASLVGPGHAFVGAGRFTIDGNLLVPGDSLRLSAPARIEGAGELFVLTFSP